MVDAARVRALLSRLRGRIEELGAPFAGLVPAWRTTRIDPSIALGHD